MLDVNKLTTTASLDGLIRIAITPVTSSCKGIQINNMLFLKIMTTSCLYTFGILILQLQYMSSHHTE